MITIQRATPTEALLIAAIGAKTFLESHGNSGPAGDIDAYASTTYDVKTVEEELKDHKNIIYIIYYNNQAVGYSNIVLNSPHPLIASSSVTKLERLYLLKEFYGLILGLTLFEFIIRLSKENGQTGMGLYVWTENQRAVTFYKKNGFEIIANTYFKISETHSNPNYVMYLKY